MTSRNDDRIEPRAISKGSHRPERQARFGYDFSFGYPNRDWFIATVRLFFVVPQARCREGIHWSNSVERRNAVEQQEPNSYLFSLIFFHVLTLPAGVRCHKGHSSDLFRHKFVAAETSPNDEEIRNVLTIQSEDAVHSDPI